MPFCHEYFKPRISVSIRFAFSHRVQRKVIYALVLHTACFFLFKMHDLPASSNNYFYFCYADSTVLAYVLSELNRRHNYGLDLFLLSVDEGITGYRDDSLETVKRNEIQVPPCPTAGTLSLSGPSTVNIIVCSIQTFNLVSFTIPLLQYGLPLKIVSYKDLYGWTMDDIVKAIGLKNNCTFCGVFRRQVVPTCKTCTEISFLIFN